MTSGAPLALPVIDDTSSAATVIAENSQSSAQDFTAQQVKLDSAPTYRSGIVRFSTELLSDSAFNPTDFLARAFAVRFGRGIGPDLVTALLSGAKLGVTTASASAITYAELLKIRTSVDPGYRVSGKVAWVLNDNTLAYLDSLTASTGAPLITSTYDEAGNRTLLGYRVAISASMPDIGASGKPLAFGATGHFAVRTVPQATSITPLIERCAEYGQVAFESRLRCNAGLLAAAGSDSPAKFLQCHS